MSGRFRVIDTPLSGLHLLERSRHEDERGFLSRLFCVEDLADAGWDQPVAQVNETVTNRAGTLRGMHYQVPPFSEIKLVTCLTGAILDVVVDLRQDSPTFLQHFKAELSGENARSLLIPKGFAHGFQALTDDVRLVYAHSAPFRAAAEAGLRHDDPALAIDWPLPVVSISDRDRTHPFLPSDYSGVAA